MITLRCWHAAEMFHNGMFKSIILFLLITYLLCEMCHTAQATLNQCAPCHQPSPPAWTTDAINVPPHHPWRQPLKCTAMVRFSFTHRQLAATALPAKGTIWGSDSRYCQASCHLEHRPPHQLTLHHQPSSVPHRSSPAPATAEMYHNGTFFFPSFQLFSNLCATLPFTNVCCSTNTTSSTCAASPILPYYTTSIILGMYHNSTFSFLLFNCFLIFVPHQPSPTCATPCHQP